MTAQPNHRPLISIVTVVRNDEIGLWRTRASILTQAFSDWEWVVVDGLSQDDTLNSVQDLAHDPRVRVMSEADAGLYDAMNKGAGLASGRYINLLNAGDIYSGPDALAGCAAVLQAGTADVLFTDRIAVYGAGDRLHLPARREPDRILHSLPTSHQACFIRTTLQRDFPYRLDYKVSADYRCLAEIAKSGAALDYLDHVTVVSDFGRSSTSFRRPLTVLRECARTQREVFDLPKGAIAWSALRRLGPMIFRRLAGFIPGLGVIARLTQR